MVERSAAVDPAVDELRRKARRRLVGAIVLALAAAVILPMLLEKEPRPLGEDVAVKIPAVDDSKFVNRLSPNAPPAPPGKTDTPPSAANLPAAPAVAGSAPSPAGPPASPAAPATPPAERVAAPKAAPEASSAVETKPEPRSEASVEPKSEAKGPSSGTPAKGRATEGFVVQLAAFSDDKGANALASKLKRNGYAAYTESIQTSRGTLYRVRVGGYGSREAANDARARLKSEGYSGIVAAR